MALYDENTTFLQAAVIYPTIGTAAVYVAFFAWAILASLVQLVLDVFKERKGMK